MKKEKSKETIVNKWFKELREKQKEFEELRSEILKKIENGFIRDMKNKDNEIKEVKDRLKRQQGSSEREITSLREELNEKKKAIEEMPGKLNKIVKEINFK